MTTANHKCACQLITVRDRNVPPIILKEVTSSQAGFNKKRKQIVKNGGLITGPPLRF